MATADSIDVTTLLTRLDANETLTVVDVRTPVEYETAHIAASLHFPNARFLAGAVGTGLTVAALTDTCAMGAALAKLPYNRGPQQPSARETVARLRPQRRVP